MSRQANGTYLQPANTAAISGQAISSTAFNTLVTDIGTEITNSVDRGGRSAMTAALPMGGQKITGMADPTVSTDGATKNYVDTTTAAFFSTGDVKLTFKTAADAGWLLFDDGTFGSASSGSSNRANADTLALFTLFFNNMSDTAAPLLTSGGGATTRAGQVSAANAWAANCRMSLPKTLGRALGVAGAGSGLTSRALGAPVGEEAHQLTLAELPTGITSSGSVSITVSTGGFIPFSASSYSNVALANNAGSVNIPFSASSSGSIQSLSGNNLINVTSNNTSGATHNNMQPTVFLNGMVKL